VIGINEGEGKKLEKRKVGGPILEGWGTDPPRKK